MHEWLLGSTAMVASERIKLAWGKGTVGNSTAYRRSKKFDEGEESLEDQLVPYAMKVKMVKMFIFI
ncbi:hypothetical protein KIN20_018445 [Parelaphostrongylus tenuis]|uniref:Uncharacterized protein n=1 Tax=Parelaphostrongylus tenuis TaxID=148309 RepID=A0AAD5N124_PARTN|nr:hypothetical protein KIN20_010740 [Parelaphostrongylus tenuis]KAJ1359661.1 hypothetical protein KIN20_018445 [Parelaphostrongylus tenuis]